MEQTRYNEMVKNYNENKESFSKKRIFIFGHCEASLTLIDMLLADSFEVTAILDNNRDKYGTCYRDIPVTEPRKVMEICTKETIVLIVTRFYETMSRQLRKMGFTGSICKLVDYNTYAEYSFSDDTLKRKRERLKKGQSLLESFRREYPGKFMIFCPFNALGDVYFCVSYLPFFLLRRNIEDYMIFVPSNGCRKVAELFEIETVKVVEQSELDSMIQAVIFEEDDNSFIAHQDRPYVINLHKALKVKRIPLEMIYRCGVFGLSPETEPVVPNNWKTWGRLESIKRGKAVVLSPYAKSVISLPYRIWEDIINAYIERGFQLFTNVSGEEKPLPGTEPLMADLAEMKSILEYAGTFIGIRSGLCDVIRTVDCRKIAFYPDYNYSDTVWKAVEMYSLDGFENIVIKEGTEWKKML